MKPVRLAPVRSLRPLGRVLTCVRCGLPVDVLEASVGARSLQEHRFLDERAFVCEGCLRVKA